MKFRQKSDGKIFHIGRVAAVLALGGAVSCTLVQRAERVDKTEAQLETSLSDDRAAIEELRKNIPAERKAENDALKQILDVTLEVKDPPERVREKFSRQTQRMRQDFQKQIRRERDDFNTAEKRKRDEFFDKLKLERDEFSKRNASREARKDFYNDQDERRRRFMADQKDARDRFNSDMKQRQDDFNVMMREKNNEFNQEMRNYTVRYNEKKKLEEAQRLQRNAEKLNAAPPVKYEPMKSGE